MATDAGPMSQMPQIAEGEVGSEQTIEIPASPNFVALRADMVSAWVMPSSEISLSFLAFEAHVHAISARVIEQDGAKGLLPTNMLGAPMLLEIGTAKMTSALALELVVGILRNGLQHSLYTTEQIEAALGTIPIKVQK